MKITICSNITIFEPPGNLAEKLADALTFENPKWVDNERMGRWNDGTERWLYFYESDNGTLTIPRGALGLVLWMCKKLDIHFEIQDKRRTLSMTEFAFNGTLKGYQRRAVQDILSRDFGVLQAPTGSGKTVMALASVAERRQPTLIVVHTKELLNQWIERIETFLDIPRSEIGVVGAGQKRVGERVTVGIVNSIYPVANTLKHYFGFVIVDECHRTPSRTFTEAVSTFDSKYMLGLSATPWRRDGLTKLIGWYLGNKIEVDRADLGEKDIILDVEVITRATNFTTEHDASEEYSTILNELTRDEERNRLIVSDISREVSNGGGTCLVLSDRKAHCEAIRAMLQDNGIAADVLTGAMPERDRKDIVGRLNVGDIRVLIATGQLIGEGFDCKRLSTLFLTTPIKFDGRLIQYLGRVLRPAPQKVKAVIYDYIDVKVGVLRASADARRHAFAAHCSTAQQIF